ncbi:hypothetical protein G7054_g12849 [Neopestalotiopsis clavispora]|nr:hypothetical protein G7054_g12849 [Neopestalotiopsis clavispora]
MATNGNLPSGAFITTLSGKRCTAIPKAKNYDIDIDIFILIIVIIVELLVVIVIDVNFDFNFNLDYGTNTSTTAAAAVPAQQTLTSATSATSIAQIGTQVSPVAPIQTTSSTSSSVAVAPLSSVTVPTTTTTPVVAAPTTPESELLQSQATQTQADDNNGLASTASAVETTPAAALESLVAPIESSVLSESSTLAAESSITAGNAALLTTIGTAANANGGQAEATGATTSGSGTSAAGGSNGISTSTTVAVVGGVVGGVVAFALIAFLVWFWRKRIRQKRRSTLLTPLGPESGFGNASEKVPYSISRNSIGPTGLAEKLKAAVGVNVRKIKGRFGGHSRSPSVNMNRGNSQYLERPAHSRETSADFGTSAKDRLLGFFGRFNDIARSERDDNLSSSTRDMKPMAARSNSQPDFLTLLSMDDKQLAAQAGQGRTSMSNPRRSQSAGSNEHFLGRLNLDFDSANPFSDDNAMLRDSAKVAPLTIMNPDNPFSDANAVRPPTATKQAGPATYVQNIRRSRGMSVGGATTRPPSTNAPSVWRESSASVESFATRRNKFRSDPFDLDRPELLSSSAGSVPMLPRDSRASGGVRVSGGPLPPHPAHTRNPSLTSSKYSSGVTSIDQWSDPGPDVGPASSRYDSPTLSGERKATGARRSGASQGSQGSVGKAY